MVFIKRALVFWHAVMILPGFGDHHHDCFLKRTARVIEHLKRVIKVSGVGTIRLNNWAELPDVFTPQVTFHDTLTRKHPVRISSERIDLAIVRHETTWLSSIPTWECIGRKA